MEAPRLLRHGDKEVLVFTTPSGVRAYIATCITDDALRAFAVTLRRKMRRQERARALRASKGV